MEQQQVLMQLSALQQQSEKLEQQLEVINEQLNEMQVLKQGIKNLEKKESKDILANIGKGIYVDAELKSKELLVEIGNKIVVKKTPKETIEVIDKQTEQLEDIKNQFLDQLQEVQLQLQHIVQAFQQQQAQQQKESKKK